MHKLFRIYSTVRGCETAKKDVNPFLHLRFDESGQLLLSEVKESSSDIQYLTSEVDDFIQQVQCKLHHPDFVVGNLTKSLMGDTWLIGEKYSTDDQLIINCLKADHGIERDNVLKELVLCIKNLMYVMKENEAILSSIKEKVVLWIWFKS